MTFDGRPVTKMRDLPRIVAETAVGKEVVVGVLRRGKDVKLNITLGRLEPVDLFAEIEDLPPEEIPANADSLLGLTVSVLSDELRAQFAISGRIDGVVVTEVEPGSDADDKGIRIGHTVVEVNQQTVFSVKDVETIVGTAAETGREVILLKLADPTGSRRFVAVRLNK